MYFPPRRWRGLSTPAGSPRLNEAHPLRGLLSSAMVFNNTSAWDLCGTLGRGSVAYGTVTPTVGQVGQYLRVQDAGFGMQATLSGDFTLVFMAMRATTPPGSGARGIATVISTIYLATAQRGIEIDMGNRYGDVNKFYMYHYTSPGVGFNANSAWIDGVQQSGANPCDTAITNGKWYGIAASFTNVAAGTGNLTFGGLADPAAYMEDGGVAVCYVFRGVLPDGIQRDLSLDPGQMLVWPDDRLFPAFGGTNSDVGVSLTGVGATSAAGTLSLGSSVAISGVAGTGAIGTLSPALGTAASGSAASASFGTVGATIAATSSGVAASSASGSLASAIGTSPSGSSASIGAGVIGAVIGMALTGAALTMSAGSLAYTIGFLLTGAATTADGGTLATSGGAVETVRSLTGISIRALPGNVKVTGGTRWSPSQPAAVVPPSMIGNTLQPPPRLTGDLKSDIQAQGQWLSTLYDQLVKVNNVFGRINDHETRIASLEASNDNLN